MTVHYSPFIQINPLELAMKIEKSDIEIKN